MLIANCVVGQNIKNWEKEVPKLGERSSKSEQVGKKSTQKIKIDGFGHHA